MFNLITTVCILMSVAMPTLSYLCSNYPANGTSLQFTDPEPSNLLVKDIGKSVSLLCCAANYDKITWYFQDQVYPNWNISKDQLANFIGFEQESQELYIYEVSYEMEGSYKCVISKDDGESLEFNQTLWVKPPQSGDIFARQEKNCADKSARIGENITFYCNFYIGESEICPSIVWQRNDNGTIYTFGYEQYYGPYINFTSFDVETDTCTHGEVVTIGTALHIYNVSDDAFGMFNLKLIREISVSVALNLSRMEESEDPEPQVIIEQGSALVAIGLGATLVSMFLLSLLYMYFKTDLHLLYKKNFEKKLTDDQKKFDAFISYSNSDEDREFVISKLRKFLVNDLYYNVCIDEINFLPGEDHSTESVNAVNSSRCCILVLTPDYIKHQYCSLEFSKALEKHKLKKNIIPIMFRTISPDSLNRQEALQHLIKAGEVLKWKSDGTNKTFWKKLQVRMPPTPPHPSTKKPQDKYIDRSTSTNSQAYLCPMRSESNDSGIVYSMSYDNLSQTVKDVVKEEKSNLCPV